MFNTIKDKEKKILSYIWPIQIRNITLFFCIKHLKIKNSIIEMYASNFDM